MMDSDDAERRKARNVVSVSTKSDVEGSLESFLPTKRSNLPLVDADWYQKRQKQERELNAGPSAEESKDNGIVEAQQLEAVVPRVPEVVSLSKVDKASTIKLSDCLMKATSRKGYRTARATHGVQQGCWYYEVMVQFLGDTGHCRIGWATKQAHLHAPVGFDAHGYSYRDIEGTKQHKAEKQPYGEPFSTGDVIGCMIYLPAKQVQSDSQQDDSSCENAKSCITFFKNGQSQGIAFEDFPLGEKYFPAVSMFTRPDQAIGVTLVLDFGPSFSFPTSMDINGTSLNVKPLCQATEQQSSKKGGCNATSSL